MRVTFKSLPEYYRKEESGRKSNTVRMIGDDERFKGRPTEIEIVNVRTHESFIRKITDITDYNGMRIFSWSSEE